MARLRRCRVGVRVGPRERLGGCCEGSRWLGGGVGWLRAGGCGSRAFGGWGAVARDAEDVVTAASEQEPRWRV